MVTRMPPRRQVALPRSTPHHHFIPIPLPLAALLLVYLELSTLTTAQQCTAQGNDAIFMVFQAENPDSVFFSEDGKS